MSFGPIGGGGGGGGGGGVPDDNSVTSTKIADGAVENVDLANMAAKTFKGRHTNSTGAPEDVTAANLLADLIAAAGTPTGTKFIRDDGTLATPPGGSNYSTRTFARRTFT